MSSENADFDVCILCALSNEAKAFRDIVSQKCNVSFTSGTSKQGWTYLFTTIQNDNNEPLKIMISWLPRYGPLETALLTQSLLSEFKPSFVAMTGICAGDKRKVKLGDLVIAERAFMADSGKLVIDKGSQKREYDTYTASAARDVLQFARMFDLRKDLVDTLIPPQPVHPEYHIAPMASSNAVHADNPFEEVKMPVRGTVAMDMEGAAFYQAVENFPGIRSLLVKGVSDYADGDKNDNYHQYASELSALYMLSFIKAYIRTDPLINPHKDKGMALPKNGMSVSVSLSIPSQHNEEHLQITGSSPLQVFFSYAPADEDACKELDKQLVMLRRNKVITCQYSRNVIAGQEVANEIARYMSQSQIILLLISPDYLASDEVFDSEVALACSLYEAGLAHVIPVLLRPTNDWEEAFFGKLQPLPKDGIPINNHSPRGREQAFFNVAQDIKKVVDLLTKKGK
ncbi:MAG: TIR domain-containing protein [Ktedonobacteraceae bacterium]|nr:TIR domain-containing protein [Chloroflexota bacterium]